MLTDFQDCVLSRRFVYSFQNLYPTITGSWGYLKNFAFETRQTTLQQFTRACCSLKATGCAPVGNAIINHLSNFMIEFIHYSRSTNLGHVVVGSVLQNTKKY